MPPPSFVEYPARTKQKEFSKKYPGHRHTQQNVKGRLPPPHPTTTAAVTIPSPPPRNHNNYYYT